MSEFIDFEAEFEDDIAETESFVSDGGSIIDDNEIGNDVFLQIAKSARKRW